MNFNIIDENYNLMSLMNLWIEIIREELAKKVDRYMHAM